MTAIDTRALKARQTELAQLVSLQDVPLNPRYIAGVDIGFEDGGGRHPGCCGDPHLA